MRHFIHKTVLATKDIESLAHYYQTEAGLDVALRFVNNTEDAFGFLVSMPAMGAYIGLRHPYEKLRRWHIKGFDALIIMYRQTNDGIEIVRVLHTARDIEEIFFHTQEDKDWLNDFPVGREEI